MKKEARLNIYDIAEKAEVSIATVSRVLSDSPKVKPETKKRVLQVINSTGYAPNAFARGLGLGTMKMVGILCTDIADLFYAGAVSVLEKLLRGKHLDTLLYCTGGELADKKRYMEHLVGKHVDAAILVGSTFSEQADNSHIEAVAAKIPVIIINGYVDYNGVYCVLCDEGKAMRDNVVRLYQRGCRNIMYMYDVLTYSGLHKLEGYKEGLRDCGLPENPALILRCTKELPRIIEAAGQMIHNETPDGILVSEDFIGIGALKAMASAGKALPVIGFNNSILAQCSTPALSSIDNMMEILCTTAVGILDSILNGSGVVPSKIVVDARLIERETYHSKERKEMA